MGNTEKTIVYIIGMGPGNADCLTEEAGLALAKSTVCIGAERMLSIWKSICDETQIKRQTFYNLYKADEIKTSIDRHKGEHISVLFSGDIGFYSGAKKLADLLFGENVEIHRIPGICSALYLLDKIGVCWEDAELVSNHGTCMNIPAKVLHHKKVCTLLGEKGQVSDICIRLTEVGLSDVRVTVGENLSYPEEKITAGYAKDLYERKFSKLAVALFEYDNPQPETIAPGICDDAFIRGKVPMTKAEVRAIVISKLGITQPEDGTNPVVYDVGAGTGSVSIELCLLLENGSVYSIEKNPEAVSLLHENRKRFHAGNMEIIEGEATEVIPNLPAPTHVFIGGSNGNLMDIVKLVYDKNPHAAIVITAVTLETQAALLTLAKLTKQCGKSFDMIQMAVTRSKVAGDYHLQQAENPVWIATIR